MALYKKLRKLFISHRTLALLLVITITVSPIYFVLPAGVSGASVALTVTPTSIPVGGKVQFAGTATLDSAESITAAQLVVTGPQPFTKTLPLTSGTSDLGDGFTVTSVAGSGLTVPSAGSTVVTIPQGTIPGTTGSVTWYIDWNPQVLIDPQPAALAGPLSAPDFDFSVPTPPAPPTVPTSAALTSDIDDTTPTITWAAPATAAGGIAEYEVALDGGSFTSVGTATTYTESNTLSFDQHDLDIRAIDNFGQTGQSVLFQFQLAQAPTVSINIEGPNTNNGQVPNTFYFRANVNGCADPFNPWDTDPTCTIQFDWGDGSNPETITDTMSSFPHQYTAAGSYTVTLTATNEFSQVGTGTLSVTMTPAPPSPSFTYSPTTGILAGQTVQFTDTSTNDPTGWTWMAQTMGPGSVSPGSSSSQNPTFTFNQSGTYEISLNASNAGGQSFNQARSTISVANPAPTPVITASTTSGDAPLNVNFDGDNSQNCGDGGNDCTFSWDFGDGTTSSNTRPNKNYGTAGSYTVTLVATNETGSGTTTKTITVSQPAPQFQHFNVSGPDSGEASFSVSWNYGVENCGSGICTYAWDFDGDNVTDSTAPNPSYTYTTPGSYTAKLTITNSGGSASRTSNITVTQPAPVVDFTADVVSGLAPLTVQFTDLSTNTPNGWLWNFGDDGQSGSQNPSHTFQNPGLYSIDLTAQNDTGNDWKQKLAYIDVSGEGGSYLPNYNSGSNGVLLAKPLVDEKFPNFPASSPEFMVPFWEGVQTPINVKSVAGAEIGGQPYLFVAVQGYPGMPDVILAVNFDFGYIENSFTATGTVEGLDTVYTGGNWYLGAVSDTGTITLYKGDPTDFNQFGTQVGDSYIIPGLNGKTVKGLTYDGSGNFYVSETVSPPSNITIVKVSASVSGNSVTFSEVTQLSVATSQFDGGFEALGYFSGNIYGVTPSGMFVQIDPSGGFTKKIESGLETDITGLTFFENTLAFSRQNDDSIYFSTYAEEVQLDAPSTQARAAAYDSATDQLYIVTDGYPTDVVLISDMSGNLVGGFKLPSDQVEAITFFGGALYIGDGASIVKINKTTGAVIETTKNLSNFISQIGGLTDNGTNLIAVARWDDKFFEVTTGGGLAGSKNITQSGGNYPPGGGESIVYATIESVNYVFVSKFETVYKINASTGLIEQIFSANPSASPTNITGMTVVGDVVILADADSAKLFVATKPGVPDPETTTTGAYTATLIVTVDGTQVSSSAASFTVTRIDTIDLQITSPTAGASFTGDTITVTGTVNDPTISVATIGILLPSTVLYTSGFETNAARAKVTTTALTQGVGWNLTNTFKDGLSKANGSYAAYYGNTSTFSYDSGVTTEQSGNSGDLTTSSFNVSGTNTNLKFKTWRQAEGGAQYDRSTVVACTTANVCTVLTQIVDFGPLGTKVNPGTNFVSEGTKYTFVPNASYLSGTPQLALVTLSLGSFANQTIYLKFGFNTIDNYENQLEGWYIDDIVVVGSGLKGVTGNLAGDNSKTFSQEFVLAEGTNSITVSVTRNAYKPVLTVSKVLNVELDTQGPVITIDPVTSPTNNSFQTVSGSYVESNPSILKVFLNSKAAPLTKITSFVAEDPTFSIPSVSLIEGPNLIEVELTDASGLTQKVSATIILDTTPPTITAITPIYPLGQTSSRPASTNAGQGDDIIFQLTVADTATAVTSVTATSPSGASLGAFAATSTLPSAVVDMYGITGNYVLLANAPYGQPPGPFQITVTATDGAGNSGTSTVTATITAALQAFNFFLMPGGNFIGLPIQPDSNSIATLTSSILGKGLATGTVTGVTVADLIDTNATFITAGVEAGDKVVNNTTAATYTIVNVTSETILQLTGGPPVVGDSYTVKGGVIDTIQYYDKSILTSGATSSFAASKLIDSTKQFIRGSIQGGDIVQVGDLVYNDTDQTVASVTAVDSETALSLDKDLFAGKTTGVDSVNYTIRLIPQAGEASTRTAQGAFQVYSSGAGFDSLTSMESLKGYWLFADSGDFTLSDPIAAGFPNTPSPIKFSYTGGLIVAGQVPPTRDLPRGWSAVSILSEDPVTAEKVFKSLVGGQGQRSDVSRYRYRNALEFDFSTGVVTFFSGSFDKIFSEDNISPGDGVWVFLTNAATLTP